MSNQEIIEKIATIENGLAATKDPVTIKMLQTGLNQYKSMLQKKSEEQKEQVPEQKVNQKLEKVFKLETQKIEITLYKKDPILQTEQQLQDYTRKYFTVVFGLKKFQEGMKNNNLDCLLSSICFYNLCQYFAGWKHFRKEIELKDVLIDFSKYSLGKKEQARILLDFLKNKMK